MQATTDPRVAELEAEGLSTSDAQSVAEAEGLEAPAPFYCDWWMENRAKCPELGTEYVEDRDGAPLRFCQQHRPLAHKQYPVEQPHGCPNCWYGGTEACPRCAIFGAHGGDCLHGAIEAQAEAARYDSIEGVRPPRGAGRYDQPVRFRMLGDGTEPIFEGWTDGSRWNGWLNVEVTPETRDAIVQWLERDAEREGLSRDDMVSGIDELPVEGGRVSLANGYCCELADDEGPMHTADCIEGGQVGCIASCVAARNGE
jgi:hypothetical protein